MVFKTFLDYFKVIGEGASSKDKAILLRYFLKMPIRYVSKHVFKKPEYTLADNVTLKNRYGTFFCGRDIFSVWGCSSFYEKELDNYFQIPEGSFIDVGANLGRWSIILSRKIKGDNIVVAIEPDQKNIKILLRNLELNKAKKIFLEPIACSDKKGLATFYIADFGTGGHSLLKRTKNKVVVKTDTLDNIKRNYKIKKVGLLKVDVEGAEVDVLNGAKKLIKEDRPNIIFEAWNRENLIKVVEFLKEFDYRIKKIDKQNYFAFQ